MIKQIFLISFLSVVVLGSLGCKKNTAAGCSIAWATELSNEIQAVQDAALAYANNPTQENCLAYKGTLQNYVDRLRTYGNCSNLTGQDRVQWQATLDQAQQDVNDINCN